MLLSMRLARLRRVMGGVGGVAVRYLGMMRRLFVIARLVVFGGFLEVLRGCLVVGRSRRVVLEQWCRQSFVCILDCLGWIIAGRARSSPAGPVRSITAFLLTQRSRGAAQLSAHAVDGLLASE